MLISMEIAYYQKNGSFQGQATFKEKLRDKDKMKFLEMTAYTCKRIGDIPQCCTLGRSLGRVFQEVWDIDWVEGA